MGKFCETGNGELISFKLFIAGFTFVRNAVRYDYPVKESILSLLPLVDELIVCIGNSDDGTAALIQSLNEPKIRILHSIWDDSLREGGRVLALETDKAMDAVSKHADWAIYLQADEVLHEKDYPAIRNALADNFPKKDIEGLLLNYIHFYGSYDYTGNSRRWYRHEIRIIRNDPSIRSYRDAQGFRKNGRKLNVKKINASVYHYGWVKNPQHQLEKQKNFHKLWHDDTWMKEKVSQDEFDYSEIDSLSRFSGTHPVVMKQRIRKMNWQFNYDASKKKLKLKDRLLQGFERFTGYRLFEYKNYRLIR
jgi:glycosyltransferase involved in cell wall biosynthesis